MSKIIKVSCCADCPFHGKCKAWKKLTKQERVILTFGASIPQDFLLKTCHLEDEK